MTRLAMTLLLLAAGSAAALAGDPEAGAIVFKKCAICHAIGPGAANKVGPHLNGIVGRPAGSVPDYNYSDVNKHSGIVWDEATLTVYLADPRGMLPGTKMTFAGLSKDADIANVIAYLARFGPDGEPPAN